MVTALYLILCVGFLEVFSLDGLANVGEAGTAAAQAVFGPIGVVVVTALIILAMIGSLNGSVLTGSRIAYAMAEQGDCTPSAWRIKRYQYSDNEVALLEKELGFELYPEDKTPEFFIASDAEGNFLGVAIFIDPRTKPKVLDGSVLTLEVGIGVDARGKVALGR